MMRWVNRTITHETIENCAMKILSSTPSVLAIKDLDFSRGILIPHTWFSEILGKSGAPDTTAIVLLSEIVYWYRLMPIYENNELKGYSKKFVGEKLQKQSKDFAQKFGWSAKSVNEALNRLVDYQLITREFKDVNCNGYVAQERQFIDIIAENIVKITFRNEEVDTNSTNDSFTPSKPFVDTPLNESFTPPKRIVEHTKITNTKDYSNTKVSFSSAPIGAVPKEEEISLKNFEEEAEVVDAFDTADFPPTPDCAHPLPPTTIEELTAFAKAQGCNGKSEHYAYEFFHSWAAKDWQVNNKGSRMKDVQKWFNKFLSEKTKPKEKAHPAYSDCLSVFYEQHEERFQRAYIFEDRDGVALKSILEKLEREIAGKVKRDNEKMGIVNLDKIEITPKQVVDAFLYILKKNQVEWVNQNFTLYNINSQFNNIINSIRENHHANGQQSTTRTKSDNRAKSHQELAYETYRFVAAKHGISVEELLARQSAGDNDFC